MATERSLERCGVDAFDLLLLHNPDRTGYTSEAVWDALEAVRADGLTRRLGVAPMTAATRIGAPPGVPWIAVAFSSTSQPVTLPDIDLILGERGERRRS